MADGGIKSVQRGYYAMDGNTIGVAISIGTVDLSKSFVTLSHEGENDESKSFFYAELNETIYGSRILISRGSALNTVEINWEVVEFA